MEWGKGASASDFLGLATHARRPLAGKRGLGKCRVKVKWSSIKGKGMGGSALRTSVWEYNPTRPRSSRPGIQEDHGHTSTTHLRCGVFQGTLAHLSGAGGSMNRGLYHGNGDDESRTMWTSFLGVGDWSWLSSVVVCGEQCGYGYKTV